MDLETVTLVSILLLLVETLQDPPLNLDDYIGERNLPSLDVENVKQPISKSQTVESDEQSQRKISLETFAQILMWSFELQGKRGRMAKKKAKKKAAKPA